MPATIALPPPTSSALAPARSDSFFASPYTRAAMAASVSPGRTTWEKPSERDGSAARNRQAAAAAHFLIRRPSFVRHGSVASIRLRLRVDLDIRKGWEGGRLLRFRDRESHPHLEPPLFAGRQGYRPS